MSLVLSSEVAAAPLMTKRELANFLKTSLPTLTAWLDRWPEFPVRERGTNGRSYKFDPRDVCTFLRARQQEDADRRAERDEQLAQLLLPFGPEPAKPSSPQPSLDDQIKALKLNDLRLAQAQRARSLVSTVEVSELLTKVFGDIGRGMRGFLGQLAREDGWPAAIRTERERRLAELQQQFVRDAAEFLRQPPRVMDTEDDATDHALAV